MKDQSLVRKENAIRPDREGNQISIDYFIHNFTRRGQIELKTLPNSVLDVQSDTTLTILVENWKDLIK